MLLFQMNTNALLQTIGLVIVQAIFQAPIYFLAVYWAIKYANKQVNKNQIKMENK